MLYFKIFSVKATFLLKKLLRANFTDFFSAIAFTVQVWKNEKFTLTKKDYLVKSHIYLVFSSVKTKNVALTEVLAKKCESKFL